MKIEDIQVEGEYAVGNPFVETVQRYKVISIDRVSNRVVASAASHYPHWPESLTPQRFLRPWKEHSQIKNQVRAVSELLGEEMRQCGIEGDHRADYEQLRGLVTLKLSPQAAQELVMALRRNAPTTEGDPFADLLG